tara:strand:- start:477 stop:1535 length:1059 start_codon:yes stop_codon:yes gene_type:complete
MINSDRIKEILEELGYKLSDKGSYWQCAALYRNGDNQTALQIYKDTGAWKDYVKGTNFMSFKQLLVLTLNSNDPDLLKKYLDPSAITFLQTKSRAKEEKIESEDIYPPSLLDNLFPHYKFYNDRGIDDEVLELLKGGLATKGQMYQRFVFPIFNEYGQIHGFSGRDMSGKEGKPKWKHMGRKTNWVYPAFVPEANGKSLFENTDTTSIIIVESIGDCLSLLQRGYKNVLVSFGLDLSSKVMCSLIRFNVDKVYLSFNNDSGKDNNRGMNACVKSYLKLLNFFDKDSIKICLPIKNDFGDMNGSDFSKWKDKMNFIDENDQVPKIISFAKKLKKQNGLSKTLIKQLQSIDEET